MEGKSARLDLMQIAVIIRFSPPFDSGLIGRCWASVSAHINISACSDGDFNSKYTFSLQLFARGGYSVTLFDVVADQLQNALVAIEKQLKMLEGDGLLREGQTASELMRSVSVSSDLKEAMEGTDYVQVAIYCSKVDQI